MISHHALLDPHDKDAQYCRLLQETWDSIFETIENEFIHLQQRREEVIIESEPEAVPFISEAVALLEERKQKREDLYMSCHNGKKYVNKNVSPLSYSQVIGENDQND